MRPITFTKNYEIRPDPFQHAKALRQLAARNRMNIDNYFLSHTRKIDLYEMQLQDILTQVPVLGDAGKFLTDILRRDHHAVQGQLRRFK